MCIGSNSVNQAQDLISVTKFEDFPNSLLPNLHAALLTILHAAPRQQLSRPGSSVQPR